MTKKTNAGLLSVLLLSLACQAGESSSQPETGSPTIEVAPPAEWTENMVEVPAGPFQFGATERQFDFFVRQSLFSFPGMVEGLRQSFIIPPQEVTLPSFSIDRFEVTNEQYRQFILATDYTPADSTDYLKHWLNTTTYPDWAASFPVVWISQRDGQAFCQWRGGYLPDEQQWEKAARGADLRFFPWGDLRPNRQTANFNTGKPEPVGNRPGDASPYEVYDMGGNVSELTSTLDTRSDASLVVSRGGSFRSQARDMVTYKRELLAPNTRSDLLGCRCAMD